MGQCRSCLREIAERGYGLCSECASRRANDARDELAEVVKERDELKARLAELERAFLSFTSLLDEHPEGWDGPCECRLCMSYTEP